MTSPRRRHTYANHNHHDNIHAYPHTRDIDIEQSMDNLSPNQRAPPPCSRASMIHHQANDEYVMLHTYRCLDIFNNSINQRELCVSPFKAITTHRKRVRARSFIDELTRKRSRFLCMPQILDTLLLTNPREASFNGFVDQSQRKRLRQVFIYTSSCLHRWMSYLQEYLLSSSL